MANKLVLMQEGYDADALGSALFVKWYFEKYEQDEVYILAGKYAAEMTGKWVYEHTQIYKDAPKFWNNFDCIVVDTHCPIRLGKDLRGVLKRAQKVTVYDHHSNYKLEEWQKHNKKTELIINPNSQSCCQHVYECLMKDKKDEVVDDPRVATALLYGVFEDTLQLTNTNDSSRNFVHELIKNGADICKIMEKSSFFHYSFPKLKYFSKVISDSIYSRRAKILVLQTNYMDYKEIVYKFNPKQRFLHTPLYILSFLKSQKIKFNPGTNANLMIYQYLTVKGQIIFSIVLDVLKWSSKIQEALSEMGLTLVRSEQNRYFMTCYSNNIDMTLKKIENVFSDR